MSSVTLWHWIAAALAVVIPFWREWGRRITEKKLLARWEREQEDASIDSAKRRDLILSAAALQNISTANLQWQLGTIEGLLVLLILVLIFA